MSTNCMDLHPADQARLDYHNTLRNALAGSPDVQTLLASFRSAQEPFIQYLRGLGAQFMDTHADVEDGELVKMVFREAGRMVTEGDFPALAAAYSAFKIERAVSRNVKRNFLMENDMTKIYRDNVVKLIYESPGVETLYLPKKKVAYPTKGKWVCETKEIHDLWHYHLRYDPKADNRLPRHEPVVISESKLAKVVSASESCIVYDQKNPEEIVLIVLRDVVINPDVLEWLDGNAGEATSTRRNIRRDDEGILVMIGLSAGARSKPCFHWVRNLLKKHSEDTVDRFDRSQCSSFGFFWNLLHHRIPSEILDNIKKWMDETMIPSMSPEWQELSRQGSYTIELPNQSMTFNDVPLAPPAGVMAHNYARPMHFERQPHKWAAALTTSRRGETSDGGHFYLGSYGIKVEATANSLVVWQPGHVHGTSLQNRSPYDKDPAFLQQGMAIVTSARLSGVWEKYAMQLGSDMEAVNEEARKAEEEIYYGSDETGDEIYK